MIILASVLCIGLLWGVIKLSVKVAWGLAKVIGFILSIIALPLLIVLALTTAGAVLLLPVLLLAGAVAILAAA